MIPKTEQEIINLLAKRNPLSISEIATELNLTKADIRYHIKNLLLKNKLIKVSPRKGIPGRPAIRYSISNDVYNNNLEFLANSLLSLSSDKTELVERLADCFLSEETTEKYQPILSKLNFLMSKLSNMNYSSRWETQFQGPIIYFANCPYRQLLKNHPELCEMDREIISKFLKHDVVTLNTIANGSYFCKFHVLIKNPTM